MPVVSSYCKQELMCEKDWGTWRNTDGNNRACPISSSKDKMKQAHRELGLEPIFDLLRSRTRFEREERTKTNCKW